MNTTLHVLHLEDNLKDAALIEAFLETEGISCDINCVSRRNDFCAGLVRPNLDIILSDFTMPGFDGLSALEIARKQRPEVPFIFLSGTIGELLAVEAMKEGATDYVVKDHMMRLPVAIRRAMRERDEARHRIVMAEELRKSEERFKLAARATQDMVWDWDLKTNLVWRSENYETLFGGSSDEPQVDHWLKRIHAEDRDRMLAGVRAVIESQVDTWTDEYRVHRADGTVANVLDRGCIIRDSTGQAIRIIGATMDMTERKRIEAEYLRTQRVETIGALAGGIAHDLNNALGPVLMGIQMLRNEPLSSEAARMLEIMNKSALRSAEMVGQVLSFSRGVGGQLTEINVKSLAEEMVRMAEKTFPRAIEISTALPEGLARVRGNATQLHQVLLNLCVNARDAMPEGGKLTIEAENATVDRAELPAGRGLNPGTYVVLKISDTGHGIPREILDRISSRFSRRKN